jgi:tRNA-binding protein
LASLDDFLSLEVRVGTIVSARPLRGALRPSLALEIDFGEQGRRAASAEITDLYQADELVGLQVAAVLNLPARQVAGLESQVLVLSVDNGRGEHLLLIPERPVPDGARVGPLS